MKSTLSLQTRSFGSKSCSNTQSWTRDHCPAKHWRQVRGFVFPTSEFFLPEVRWERLFQSRACAEHGETGARVLLTAYQPSFCTDVDHQKLFGYFLDRLWKPKPRNKSPQRPNKVIPVQTEPRTMRSRAGWALLSVIPCYQYRAEGRMGYSDPTAGRDLLGNRSLCFIFICAFGVVTLLQQILYGKNYIRRYKLIDFIVPQLWWQWV